MFIARSEARVRAARLAFVLLAALPAAGLVSWAAYLRSDAHRAAVEREWQTATGLPLAIGRVEHPRPGVIRAVDCLLPAGSDRPAFAVPLIELESSADEDRLRIDRLACDPAAASLFAAAARAWLMESLRFRRTCIVEVADFHWAGEPLPESPVDRPVAVPLRIECVVRDDSRAVRAVRRGTGGDEVRIVRHLRQGPADALDRFEIDAVCSEPVPLAVLATAGGISPDVATVAAAAARVAGELHAVREGGRWRGTAHGRVTGLDLAPLAALVGSRAAGTAALEVARLEWDHSRLQHGLIEAFTGPGWIDGRLFDRLVLATGARPGAASENTTEAGRSFDAAACLATVGEHGVQFLPTPRLPAALAVRASGIVLAPPTAPVPGDRIAWMLTAPGTAFGPSAGPGAWLMSVLPPPAPLKTGSERHF